MHPSFILLIVAAGLTAIGIGFFALSRALSSQVQPQWARTTGKWQPWQPIGRQRIHYVVDGVVYEAYDNTTRRLPRWGEDEVLYDPQWPSRAVVDSGAGPGGYTFGAAIAFWTGAGCCAFVAAVLPFVIAQVEGLSAR